MFFLLLVWKSKKKNPTLIKTLKKILTKKLFTTAHHQKLKYGISPGHYYDNCEWMYTKKIWKLRAAMSQNLEEKQREE